MNSKGTKIQLIAAVFASAIGLGASSALAQTNISEVETQNSGTPAFLQTQPIITDVASAPGSVDGYNYTSWSYFVQDSSGSLDLFYSSSLNTGYTPTKGDILNVQGNFSPFDGIPEIANSSANPLVVSKVSHNNIIPAPPIATIPQINVTSASANGIINTPYAGYYFQLDDVTISGAPTLWPTHANGTYTITDQSDDSMVLYFWASSYSQVGAMGGTAVPTGEVDIDGFVDYFAGSSEAEFIPLSITLVPEPAVMTLFGVGSAFAGLVCYRLRKKA